MSRGQKRYHAVEQKTTRNTSLMTAVAAVTASPMEKVLRRGCAVLYAEITSTIACNSVSFLFLFLGGWVEVGVWVDGC